MTQELVFLIGVIAGGLIVAFFMMAGRVAAEADREIKKADDVIAEAARRERDHEREVERRWTTRMEDFRATNRRLIDGR
jgi:hypothetical protein